jgi:deoxyribonuclease V
LLRRAEWEESCRGVRGSVSYSRAREAQLRLRELLRLDYEPPEPKVIAAVDAAYWGQGGIYGVAAVLVIDLLGRSASLYYSYGPVCVPYIPGLLAFREMEVMAPALVRARRRGFDVILVDGHGVAHPRGLGIASHVGVALRAPSVGVAKGRLYGEEGPCAYGACLYADGKPVGAILTSPTGSKVYVSPGNMVTLDYSVRLASSLMARGLRLPYPLQLADAATKDLRDQLRGESPRGVTVEEVELNHRSLKGFKNLYSLLGLVPISPWLGPP